MPVIAAKEAFELLVNSLQCFKATLDRNIEDIVKAKAPDSLRVVPERRFDLAQGSLCDRDIMLDVAGDVWRVSKLADSFLNKYCCLQNMRGKAQGAGCDAEGIHLSGVGLAERDLSRIKRNFSPNSMHVVLPDYLDNVRIPESEFLKTDEEAPGEVG